MKTNKDMREEAKQSLAKEMLKLNRDPSFVKYITGVSIKRMVELGLLKEVIIKDFKTGVETKTGYYRAAR